MYRSWKYCQELNLVFEPKIAIARILADLNLAVRYRIAIRIYASRKFWRILITLIPRAHMFSRNWFCLLVIISMKIIQSQNLGITATHNHNQEYGTMNSSKNLLHCDFNRSERSIGIINIASSLVMPTNCTFNCFPLVHTI